MIIAINFEYIILGLLIRLIEKKKIPVYLKIRDLKLIDILSTPSVVRKINHAKYKSYVNKKFHEK